MVSPGRTKATVNRAVETVQALVAAACPAEDNDHRREGSRESVFFSEPLHEGLSTNTQHP